ncbi:unnamed protein product [Amoebophrya sp. A25]|nr:unnamed protein product [Amoebophrya sp. A25]|eukprot:GSA25T00028019001.1
MTYELNSNSGCSMFLTLSWSNNRNEHPRISISETSSSLQSKARPSLLRIMSVLHLLCQ